LNKNVEEVALVDGVFFSTHKNRIKKHFNKDVEGFHFYEVDFCIRNQIEGVKIGVHTLIKLTHKSVGQTNEQWEVNRQKFIETYKEVLPINIPETFLNRKLKVLISCLSFNSLTGSELYNFELAKGLVENGCDVSIYSNVGGILAKEAKKLGIKLYSINEPPSHKMGDGKWGMNGPNGLVTSKEGMLYRVSSDDFDIIHSSHTPVTERMVKLYPTTPIISTIHSEVISLENPVIHENIKKYIAIRPEIKEHLINNFEIDAKDITIVYNPIDSKRFNLNGVKDDGYTLFVGTIDYLRKNAILDLIEQTKSDNEKLIIVGKENGVSVLELIGDNKHVEYHKSTTQVDKFTKNCTKTASILLGRTTAEGWLCGKDGWIYNVDDKGIISGKELVSPPVDVDKFDYKNVCNKVLTKYKEIIND
jgi:hypothetical protein